MLRQGDTPELMARADEMRRDLHGRRTYFVHSLNLNPTNICENRCELCAFWRERDAADAYVLDLDRACQRLRAARGLGLTEVHIVGGVCSELDLAYFESLIRLSRQILPEALIQGLTAVEIQYLADLEGIRVAEILRRLKDAGLGAIPGGGAEIFAQEIREHICSRKISADQWLTVHEQAHSIGLPTNATMLFGHLEGPEHLVDHLARLRDLQDRTGGFKAFVALPYHVEGTRLPVLRGPGGHTIARVVAVARLFLDNLPHIRVLANYMDRRLLAALTHGGVDDVGGTSLDERIARAAGAPEGHRFTSPDEMAALLADLNLEMVLVNSRYEPSGSTTTTEAPCGAPAVARSSSRIDKALALAEAGERLIADQAIALHDHAPFQQLGVLAHRRRLQAVPGRRGTFVIDRNISFTNVCEAGCKFCAFHVAPGSPGAFTLTIDQILEKVGEAVALGATQVMLQGGLNPDLDLPFCEQMLLRIKQTYHVWLHSFSPAEVMYLSQAEGMTPHETLKRLQEAGLDSLPGGGAEILVDDVRRRVSPRKILAQGWFDVMRAAHELGMKTTATMVYGLGETTAQRIEHLIRVRDLQDETQGFTAFIPWSFQPHATQLAGRPQTAVDYLRVVAIARLVLDNVHHLQAGWVTEGPDVAQLALSFGADDFGGVLMEERVVRATGVRYEVTAADVIARIRETGMVPVQRTTQYEPLRVLDQRDQAS